MACLEDNYRRAMFFLHLSIEQMRQVNESTADYVRAHYVSELAKIFDHTLHFERQYDLNGLSGPLAQQICEAGHQQFKHLLCQLPPAPPGFGSGLVPELNNLWKDPICTGKQKTPTSLQDLCRQLSSSSLEQKSEEPEDQGTYSLKSIVSSSTEISSRPCGKFGVIGGERRCSSHSRNNTSISGHSALLADSEPLESDGTPFSSPSGPISRPSCQFSEKYGTKRFGSRGLLSSSPESMIATGNNADGTLHEVDRLLASSLTVQDSAAKGSHCQAQRGRSGSSWADVAALSQSAGSKSNEPIKGCFNGLACVSLTPSQTLLNPPERFAVASEVETVSDQLRVVWVTGLPPRFALRDVGACLNHGATMSILLQNDASPELSGRSACIIFRDASNAAFFMLDNAMVASGNGHAVKDELSLPDPPSSAAAALFTDTAPNAQVTLGAPYPLDDALLSMNPPESARRRLKWTRSRMFYDVSLAQFKQDVISVCGIDNVELFHFYNPGEATAVFSSVGVAAAVRAAFVAAGSYATASCSTRNSSFTASVNTSANTSANSSSSSLFKYRSGANHGSAKSTDKGKNGASKEEVWRRRYEHVSCTYAHGFEENRPERLVSSFERNGTVRRAKETKGLVGLWSGPCTVGGVDREE